MPDLLAKSRPALVQIAGPQRAGARLSVDRRTRLDARAREKDTRGATDRAEQNWRELQLIASLSTAEGNS
jgi:hypothetical protein